MGSASRPEAAAAPAVVLDAAQRRSEARAAQDWATADDLRAEIEAAGWRVTDSGTAFRLEPAHPADVEHGGEIRYGRSDAVPSRLEEAPTRAATVILTVELGDPSAIDAVTAASRHLPEGVDLVVVGDGIGDATALGIHGALDASPIAGKGHELVRTSTPLGRAAALNAGIRRSTGAIVVVLDTSIQPTGDVVSPLVAALADPDVAVAGPFGLSSEDLRRFEEVVPASSAAVEVAAVQGYCMAFQRADAVERGPLDEGFRFYRNLDIWWSLALRDGGEGRKDTGEDAGEDTGEDGPPRRALAVPDLPLVRIEPWAWTSTPRRERDRLSKRNFYRMLDSFRDRLDLAVPPPGRG